MIRDGYGHEPEGIALAVEWLRLNTPDEEGDMDIFIKWCEIERNNLQSQLDALISGKLRFAENDGSGWMDMSAARIEWLTAKIADLDALFHARQILRLPN